jgi:hypothetical protein
VTLRRWTEYVNGTRVIGSTRIPNNRYHGHRGFVVRVMRDLETEDYLVEVRWDMNDQPVDGLTHQVMPMSYMDIDHEWRPDFERPHIIQEESLTGP